MDSAPADSKADDPSASSPLPRRPSILGRILRFALVLILLLAVYLIFTPSPIDPAAYEPPPKPEMTGATAPNDLLKQATLLAKGFVGPEGVCVDAEGNVYGGLLDGRIIRVAPDGETKVAFDTKGRPLGLDFDPQGNLIVADARRGLLSISPAGEIVVLSTTVDGKPFGFTDDLAVASDGMIYFSDASTKFGEGEYLYDLLEARPHGRLLSYNPQTKETKMLLDGLYFANGVALSQNEDFLIVNETYRYRIQKYWLQGEKAGTTELFIDNLPGFPDNVSSNGRGTFWLALYTVRNALVDQLHPYPWAKSALSKLPKSLWPQPKPYAFVVSLDESGKITGSYQDPSGENLQAVTSVFERDGYLYLGSLLNDRIGKFKLP